MQQQGQLAYLLDSAGWCPNPATTLDYTIFKPDDWRYAAAEHADPANRISTIQAAFLPAQQTQEDQQGQPPVSQRQILHEQHDEEQVLYSQAAAAVGPNVDNSGELTGVDQHRREKARKSQARHRERKKERLEALKSSNEELAIRSKSVQGELDALKIQKRTLEIELSRKSSMLDSADCEPEQGHKASLGFSAQDLEGFSSRLGIRLEMLDMPRKLTRSEAIELSLKEHASIWKEQCRLAEDLLKQTGGDVDTPTGKSLQALLNERHGLLAWTYANKPIIVYRLMTKKLDDPSVPDDDPPTPIFWRRILDAMHLTANQQTYLLKLGVTSQETYTGLWNTVANFRSHSRELLSKKNRHLPAQAAKVAPPYSALKPGLDTGIKGPAGWTAGTQVMWLDIWRALQENLDAFHICHSIFTVKVFERAQGFSVIQEANLMVQSFPRAPNIFALLEQLAIVPDEGGKPLAADFQQKDGESSLIPSHFFPKEPYVPLADKLENAINAVNKN